MVTPVPSGGGGGGGGGGRRGRGCGCHSEPQTVLAWTILKKREGAGKTVELEPALGFETYSYRVTALFPKPRAGSSGRSGEVEWAGGKKEGFNSQESTLGAHLLAYLWARRNQESMRRSVVNVGHAGGYFSFKRKTS